MKTQTKAPEKRKKSTTPVVVNALNAFISDRGYRGKGMSEHVARLIRRNRLRGRASAGRADSVLSVFTDPRAIMATEAVIRITGETLAKKRKR